MVGRNEVRAAVREIIAEVWRRFVRFLFRSPPAPPFLSPPSIANDKGFLFISKFGAVLLTFGKPAGKQLSFVARTLLHIDLYCVTL